MCSVFFLLFFFFLLFETDSLEKQNKKLQNHQHIFGRVTVRIGSVLVLVFVIIVAAYQMRNHNEQYTTLLNKLNSILCLWPCDLWKVDTIFAPSLWCLLGYLGNSLCQLPLHLCALSLCTVPVLPLVVRWVKKSLSNRPAIQRIYGRAFKLAANFKQNIHTWPHRKRGREQAMEREKAKKRTKRKKGDFNIHFTHVNILLKCS